MKKSLLILSLLFTAQGVFSANSSDAAKRIADKIQAALMPSDLIQNSISVDLGDGNIFTAVIYKTSCNNYSYVGTVTNAGTLLGTTYATFQTSTVNGVETIQDSSFSETYSNDPTGTLVKPRHDTIKSAIQNIH